MRGASRVYRGGSVEPADAAAQVTALVMILKGLNRHLDTVEALSISVVIWCGQNVFAHNLVKIGALAS
jgi:hypothetical protein